MSLSTTPTPETAPSFRLGYRPSLDGVRGIAVLVVFASHLRLIYGAYVGVEALLVLSGFLITLLLIEEQEKRGRISLGNFYRKRFRRLLPPLFALFVFGAVGEAILTSRSVGQIATEVAVAALFVANLFTFHQTATPVLGHTWTLALEVQFYLVWPVALFFLLRHGASRRRVIQLVIVAIVASAGWRLGLFMLRPPNGPAQHMLLMRLYLYPDTHVDGLFVGCLAGLLVGWGRLPDTERFRKWVRNWAWVSIGVLAYLAVRSNYEKHFCYCGGFTATALMFTTILVWLVTAPSKWVLRVLEWPLLVGIGRTSYALYLFHMPICMWMDPRSPGMIALAAGLSFALAVMSFYLIERPLGSVHRRTTPGSAPAAAPAWGGLLGRAARSLTWPRAATSARPDR